jgi:hypothetical protein
MALLRDRGSAAMAKPSILLLLALAAIAQAQNDDATTTQAKQTNTNTAQKTTAAASAGDGSDVSITDLPDLSTAATVGAASSVSVTDAPALSTSSIYHLSDVPTIAGYGVPTQGVPWTAGAPFMQTSKLPEGTVFIIVGAILGFLGAAVLAWRGMVAYSLHRSVKRAALGTHYNDSMLKLSKPNIGGNAAALGSNLSLDRLSAPAGKLSKTHGRTTSASPLTGTTAARNSSLFFSPTAGAGAHHASPSAALMSHNNRSSAYLPAGYYAAPGAAAPNSGSKHASVGAGATARLSSLNPNHPSNKGYSQPTDFAPSPPDSPSIAPRPSTGGTTGTMGTRRGYERMSGMGNQDNWSNLNIPGGAPAGQRAPSANLEDLFEHHGNGMRGF